MYSELNKAMQILNEGIEIESKFTMYMGKFRIILQFSDSLADALLTKHMGKISQRMLPSYRH